MNTMWNYRKEIREMMKILWKIKDLLCKNEQ
jgi:hypothetical protein